MNPHCPNKEKAMQDRKQKWYVPWFTFIGGSVVVVGLISGAFFGLKSFYDWGSRDATRAVTRDFMVRLEEAKNNHDLLQATVLSSVKVFTKIEENPQDFVYEGKCELNSFRAQIEMMDAGARYGDYFYEFERNSASKITGLKDPVLYNDFQTRTR